MMFVSVRERMVCCIDPICSAVLTDSKERGRIVIGWNRSR